MEVDPSRTALIVVHLQGDVVTADGAFGGFFAEMVEKGSILQVAARLIKAGRDAGASVVYPRMVFSEGHPELDVNAPIWAVVEEADCFLDGTPGATIVSAVAPADGDVIVDHHRIDPTFESDLLGHLKDRDIDSAIVFGVATNVSVEAAARALADHRFRVFVVEDATTAADEATHAAAIATMRLLASEVVSADDVVAALAGAEGRR